MDWMDRRTKWMEGLDKDIKASVLKHQQEALRCGERACRVGWRDEGMDGRTGWTDWMDRLDGRMEGQTGWTDEWTDEWTDWMDGQIGWMNRLDRSTDWMDGQTGRMDRLDGWKDWIHDNNYLTVLYNGTSNR